MGILIHDFMDEFYWVLLIFFSIFTLVGIGIWALWVRMVILLFRGNYSQISGVLEDVTFTEDPYDDDETIEIDFAVSGINFECSAIPEKAAQFEEGREVTVQYG